MWAIYILDKTMNHLAHRPMLVPEKDVSNLMLPVPEAIWVSPEIEHDERLEERRWLQARQITGRELFSWKERRGHLQGLARGMNALHHHILIANMIEWLDGLIFYNSNGGWTEAKKQIAFAALEDYHMTFVAPFQVPVNRAPGELDFLVQAPKNSVATMMMLFYK